jgi:hypothetical protein
VTEALAIGQLEQDVRGPSTDRRRRALSNLKARATRARQSGVRDADNDALHAVRTAGVPPRREGLTTLTRLGLVDVLSAHIHIRPLYTLDLLLAATGKGIIEITNADVELFVAGRPAQTAAVLRSQIRCVYDRLVTLKMAAQNPVPRQKPWRTPLPPAFATELVTLHRYHDAQRSSRSSRRSAEEALRRATTWALSQGQADGLNDLLWEDDARLHDLAVWWAGPRENGTLRSVMCMPTLFTFVLRLWKAHGRNVTEGRDRIRRLQRSLRTSGDDTGPFDRLDLRSEDPAPAPSPERCEKLAEWYSHEVGQLRGVGVGAKTKLLALQRERLMFFILWKVGVRKSSLASFRYDELKRDDEGQWYFDSCVTKRTREPKRVVVQTWRVGDTTFSRWYLPPEFYALLVEALRDEGYDLEAYLETRAEHHLPWDTARGGTFGPHLDGKRIAPVWRGKRGHLTVGTVAGIVGRIVRGRLGMARGGAHAMRRRSIMDNNDLARKFPQAAQALQHLTPETRSIYEWSEERSVRHMFVPAVRTPASETHNAAAAPASTSEARAAATATARPRTAARRAPRLTLDHLR